MGRGRCIFRSVHTREFTEIESERDLGRFAYVIRSSQDTGYCQYATVLSVYGTCTPRTSLASSMRLRETVSTRYSLDLALHGLPVS